MSAAVQLKFESGTCTQQNAWNDAVKLLAGAVHICGSGKNHGEVPVLKISHQMQIARRPGGRVGSARVEWGVFFDESGAASVNFGG